MEDRSVDPSELSMRFAVVVGTFFLAFPFGPALAQSEDVWEAQRCVWRCDSATKGKQPAYDACVRKHCDTPAPKSKGSKQKR
jgi:hypothetical protein